MRCRSATMKYADGQAVRLWDRVAVWGPDQARGVVVFSVDTAEYSPAYPAHAWSYLGRGVMVDTDQAGLIHFSESAEGLQLLQRGGPMPPDELAALRRAGWEHSPGEWREGSGASVRVGYLNPHGQVCL